MPRYCTQCSKENKDTARFCHCCGTPLVLVLQKGSMLDLGRYEVQRSLMTGGMSAVYLLRDTRLDRECVLKEMLPPSPDPAALKEFKERFRNEALILSKLSHKNLPRVTDHFEEGNQCFLVMDYIEGDDLADLLIKKAPRGFPEKNVYSWMMEILSVLEYLHTQKPPILYRDLKPSNIMIRRADDLLFLIDFGIAKALHAAHTHKTDWGTIGYAPIEQAQGAPETRSDLYALGATMHHLLSGKAPVPFKFDPVSSLRPDVSPAVGAVIDKALKLNAHERYASAREMREALASSAPGLPGLQPIPALQSVQNTLSMPYFPAVPAAVSSIRVNQKDGAEMVLIPAGDFLMGSPKDEGSNDERPQHTVSLDEYYIYKHPVTNRQFAQFVKETGYDAEASWKRYEGTRAEKHPVVDVNWNDAMTYCRWAGGSLPTEAQWEKAARGTDGREYPWGNNWDGSRCNWKKGPKVAGMANIYDWRGTVPVGSFPAGASPFGVHDMAGNVWEWCSDGYDGTYYTSSPSRNPEGDKKGHARVYRGGSWNSESLTHLRCAMRDKTEPEESSWYLGFRVCLPATSP